MKGRSPCGLPPSPAPMVMPGTVRSASCRLRALESLRTCCGTTVTERGVSISGAVYFEDCARSTWYDSLSAVSCTWMGVSSRASLSAARASGLPDKATPAAVARRPSPGPGNRRGHAAASLAEPSVHVRCAAAQGVPAPVQLLPGGGFLRLSRGQRHPPGWQRHGAGAHRCLLHAVLQRPGGLRRCAPAPCRCQPGG